MRRLIYILVSLCLLSSCKTKQFVLRNEKLIIHDTIRDYRTIEKFRAINDTLIIENPCDSLGILTRFYSKITIPQGNIILRSQNGTIKATINLDSIQNVYESKYKSNHSDKSLIFEKVVVKSVVPNWAIITIFIESILILGYLYFRFINPFK